MKKFFLLSLAALVLLGSLPFASLQAEPLRIPELINYQANVLDQEMEPMTGTRSVVFEIYDTEFGGSPIWLEQQDVTFQNGYMNVYLGQLNELGILNFDKQYYLQITIGNGEPYKRVRLSATPYSFSAQYAADADTATYAFMAESVIDGAITQEKLAPGVQAIPWGDAGGDLMGQYPNPVLRPGAVLDNIEDGSLTLEKLAPGEAYHIKTLPGGPASGDLTGNYPDPLIAPKVIDWENIKDQGVRTENIADRAVTGIKIAEDAVGDFQLAPTTVDEGLYGNANHVGSFIVNEDGRLTWAEDVRILIEYDQVIPGQPGDFFVTDAEGNTMWQGIMLSDHFVGDGITEDIAIDEDVITEYELDQILTSEEGNYGDEYHVGGFYVNENGRIEFAEDILIQAMDNGTTSDVEVAGTDINDLDLQLYQNVVGMEELNASYAGEDPFFKPDGVEDNGGFIYYNFDEGGMTWAPAAIDDESPVWDAANQRFYWGTPSVMVEDIDVEGEGDYGDAIIVNEDGDAVWGRAMVDEDSYMLVGDNTNDPLALRTDTEYQYDVIKYDADMQDWVPGMVDQTNLYTLTLGHELNEMQDGYSLVWNWDSETQTGIMDWDFAMTNTAGFIVGDGTEDDPVRLNREGVGAWDMLFFDPWAGDDQNGEWINTHEVPLDEVGVAWNGGFPGYKLGMADDGYSLEMQAPVETNPNTFIGDGAFDTPLDIATGGIVSDMIANDNVLENHIPHGEIKDYHIYGNDVVGDVLVSQGDYTVAWERAMVDVTGNMLTGDNTNTPIALVSEPGFENMLMIHDGTDWTTGMIETDNIEYAGVDVDRLATGGNDGDAIINDVAAGEAVWGRAMVDVTGNMLEGNNTDTPIALVTDASYENNVLAYDALLGDWAPSMVTRHQLRTQTVGGDLGANEDGFALVWDNAADQMDWVEMSVNTASPIVGDGTAADPVTMMDGTDMYDVLAWDGTDWNPDRLTGDYFENGTIQVVKLDPTGGNEGDAPIITPDGDADWGRAMVDVTGNMLEGNNTDEPIALVSDPTYENMVMMHDGTDWMPDFVSGDNIEDNTLPINKLEAGDTEGQIIWWDNTGVGSWAFSEGPAPLDTYVPHWDADLNGGTIVWEEDGLTIPYEWTGSSSGVDLFTLTKEDEPGDGIVVTVPDADPAGSAMVLEGGGASMPTLQVTRNTTGAIDEGVIGIDANVNTPDTDAAGMNVDLTVIDDNTYNTTGVNVFSDVTGSTLGSWHDGFSTEINVAGEGDAEGYWADVTSEQDAYGFSAEVQAAGDMAVGFDAVVDGAGDALGAGVDVTAAVGGAGYEAVVVAPEAIGVYADVEGTDAAGGAMFMVDSDTEALGVDATVAAADALGYYAQITGTDAAGGALVEVGSDTEAIGFEAEVTAPEAAGAAVLVNSTDEAVGFAAEVSATNLAAGGFLEVDSDGEAVGWDVMVEAPEAAGFAAEVMGVDEAAAGYFSADASAGIAVGAIATVNDATFGDENFAYDSEIMSDMGLFASNTNGIAGMFVADPVAGADDENYVLVGRNMLTEGENGRTAYFEGYAENTIISDPWGSHAPFTDAADVEDAVLVVRNTNPDANSDNYLAAKFYGSVQINSMLSANTLVGLNQVVVGGDPAQQLVITPPAAPGAPTVFDGDVHITGTLEVDDAVDFNDNLNVDGTADFQDVATFMDQIEVQGHASFENNVDIDGDLNADGDVTFGDLMLNVPDMGMPVGVVNDGTGKIVNTNVTNLVKGAPGVPDHDGTLTPKGYVDEQDALVTADVLSRTYILHDAVPADMPNAQQLTAIEGIEFEGNNWTLRVDEDYAFDWTADHNFGANVDVDGDFDVDGETTLDNTEVEGTFNVIGETTLDNTEVDGTFDVINGDANFGQDVYVDGELDVDGDAWFWSDVDIDMDLWVWGDSYLGNTDIDGDLDVNGLATLATVDIGGGTMDNVTINGSSIGLTTPDQGRFTNLTVDNDATVGNNLDVTGNHDVTGDLNADGVVTFGDLQLNNPALSGLGIGVTTDGTGKVVNANVTDLDLTPLPDHGGTLTPKGYVDREIQEAIDLLDDEPYLTFDAATDLDDNRILATTAPLAFDANVGGAANDNATLSITPGADNTFMVTDGSGTVMFNGFNSSAHFTGDGVANALTIGADVITPTELDETATYDWSGDNTHAGAETVSGTFMLNGGDIESNIFSYDPAGTDQVDLGSEVAGLLPIANVTPGNPGELLVTNGAGDTEWMEFDYNDGQFDNNGVTGEFMIQAGGVTSTEILDGTIVEGDVDPTFVFASVSDGTNNFDVDNTDRTLNIVDDGAGFIDVTATPGTHTVTVSATINTLAPIIGDGTAATPLDLDINGTLEVDGTDQLGVNQAQDFAWTGAHLFDNVNPIVVNSGGGPLFIDYSNNGTVVSTGVQTLGPGMNGPFERMTLTPRGYVDDEIAAATADVLSRDYIVWDTPDADMPNAHQLVATDGLELDPNNWTVGIADATVFANVSDGTNNFEVNYGDPTLNIVDDGAGFIDVTATPGTNTVTVSAVINSDETLEGAGTAADPLGVDFNNTLELDGTVANQLGVNEAYDFDWSGDSQVSGTLTLGGGTIESNVFKAVTGPGTTDAVDLGTAEISGLLPLANFTPAGGAGQILVTNPAGVVDWQTFNSDAGNFTGNGVDQQFAIKTGGVNSDEILDNTIITDDIWDSYILADVGLPVAAEEFDVTDGDNNLEFAQSGMVTVNGDGGANNTITIGATAATDGGAAAGSILGDGTAGDPLMLNMGHSNSWTALQTFANVDIDGGSIDGTTIGAADPAMGTFTVANVNGALTVGTAPNTIAMAGGNMIFTSLSETMQYIGMTGKFVGSIEDLDAADGDGTLTPKGYVDELVEEVANEPILTFDNAADLSDNRILATDAPLMFDPNIAGADDGPATLSIDFVDPLYLNGTDLDVRYDNSTIGLNGSGELYVPVGGITTDEILDGTIVTGDVNDNFVFASIGTPAGAGFDLTDGVHVLNFDDNGDDSMVDVSDDGTNTVTIEATVSSNAPFNGLGTPNTPLGINLVNPLAVDGSDNLSINHVDPLYVDGTNNFNVRYDNSTIGLNGSGELYVPIGGITTDEILNETILSEDIFNGTIVSDDVNDGFVFVGVDAPNGDDFDVTDGNTGLQITESGLIEITGAAGSTNMLNFDAQIDIDPNTLEGDGFTTALGVFSDATLKEDALGLGIDLGHANHWTAEQQFDDVDIDGGDIDGTAIGANSASTGRFTTITGVNGLQIGEPAVAQITDAGGTVEFVLSDGTGQMTYGLFGAPVTSEGTFMNIAVPDLNDTDNDGTLTPKGYVDRKDEAIADEPILTFNTATDLTDNRILATNAPLVFDPNISGSDDDNATLTLNLANPLAVDGSDNLTINHVDPLYVNGGGNFDVKYDNSTIGLNGSGELYVPVGGITTDEILDGTIVTGDVNDNFVFVAVDAPNGDDFNVTDGNTGLQIADGGLIDVTGTAGTPNVLNFDAQIDIDETLIGDGFGTDLGVDYNETFALDGSNQLGLDFNESLELDGSNQVGVDYDGTSIGMIGNELAVLEGGIESFEIADGVQFVDVQYASANQFYVTDGTNTLNLTESGMIDLTFPGGQTVNIGAVAMTDGTSGSETTTGTILGDGTTANALALNLAQANTWTGVQTLPVSDAQSDALVASLNGYTTVSELDGELVNIDATLQVTANELGIDLGHANHWTAEQQFDDVDIDGGEMETVAITDGTMSGTAISNVAITNSTINNSVIGGTTPAAGTFTDLAGSSLDINGTSADAIATINNSGAGPALSADGGTGGVAIETEGNVVVHSAFVANDGSLGSSGNDLIQIGTDVSDGVNPAFDGIFMTDAGGTNTMQYDVTTGKFLGSVETLTLAEDRGTLVPKGFIEDIFDGTIDISPAQLTLEGDGVNEALNISNTGAGTDAMQVSGGDINVDQGALKVAYDASDDVPTTPAATIWQQGATATGLEMLVQPTAISGYSQSALGPALKVTKGRVVWGNVQIDYSNADDLRVSSTIGNPDYENYPVIIINGTSGANVDIDYMPDNVSVGQILYIVNALDDSYILDLTGTLNNAPANLGTISQGEVGKFVYVGTQGATSWGWMRVD